MLAAVFLERAAGLVLLAVLAALFLAALVTRVAFPFLAAALVMPIPHLEEVLPVLVVLATVISGLTAFHVILTVIVVSLAVLAALPQAGPAAPAMACNWRSTSAPCSSEEGCPRGARWAGPAC